MGIVALAVVASLLTAQESSAPAKEAAPFKTLRVGVVIHEGVEMLDFAGPVEVFDAAGSQLQIDGKPLFQTFTIAPKKGICTANGNVRLDPARRAARRSSWPRRRPGRPSAASPSARRSTRSIWTPSS